MAALQQLHSPPELPFSLCWDEVMQAALTRSLSTSLWCSAASQLQFKCRLLSASRIKAASGAPDAAAGAQPSILAGTEGTGLSWSPFHRSWLSPLSLTLSATVAVPQAGQEWAQAKAGSHPMGQFTPLKKTNVTVFTGV